MKKISYLCFVIISLTFLIAGCSNNSEDSNKEAVIKLNVTESHDLGIIAADENNVQYDIPNYDIKITDNNDNILSWDELENAKIIEVHFSEGITETCPASFSKINKVVIIS